MTSLFRIVAAGLVLAMAAPRLHAQGTPSADQIINSLRPAAPIMERPAAPIVERPAAPMIGGTRGIRPVNPGGLGDAGVASVSAAPGTATEPSRLLPSPPSGGAAPAVARPPPSIDLSVQFTTNSAQLTPPAIKTLSELGRALSSDALAQYRFRIEGHTDTVGDADLNRALSGRRAQAVVEFLSTRYKIAPSRLEAAGMGEDGLLVQTPRNTPEPRNRRVQVINIGS